jgi:hypothetical protein
MKLCLIVFILLISLPLFAQVDEDEEALAALDEFFLNTDSSTVFATLDSLLNSLRAPLKSRIMLKTGYVAKINAGSSSTLEQYGWSGGISYYNKKGPFLDINNYWNSEYDPNYYLTTVSAGYINYFKSLTYYLSYQHYFKNGESNLGFNFTDELNGALFASILFLDFGIDYSSLFGNKFTEHRINLSGNGNIKFKKAGFLDALTILPSITVTYGNQDITTYSLSRSIVDRDRLFLITETKNTFGLMNYGFSCPVSLKIKNFGILLNYQYNIPQALPEEEITLDNNSFFSASLSYLIEL